MDAPDPETRARTSAGDMHQQSPRQALGAAVKQFEALGIRSTVALRAQLTLTCGESTDPNGGLEGVLVHLCADFRRAGLPVESITTAPSPQGSRPNGHTVTIASSGDPLTVCDNHVLQRMAVVTQARQQGFHTEYAPADRLSLRVTLEPAPLDASGSPSGCTRGQAAAMGTAAAAAADGVKVNVPSGGEAVHQALARVLTGLIEGPVLAVSQVHPGFRTFHS